MPNWEPKLRPTMLEGPGVMQAAKENAAMETATLMAPKNSFMKFFKYIDASMRQRVGRNPEIFTMCTNKKMFPQEVTRKMDQTF